LVIIFGSIVLYSDLTLAAETASIRELRDAVSRLQSQRTPTDAAQYEGNFSVSRLNSVVLYDYSNRSVVTIQGSKVVSVDTFFGTQQAIESILGSGFVVDYSTHAYVITNFHVVDGVTNATITFWNGDSFPTKIVGSDAYSDLAVVSVHAPQSDLYPLEFSSSSSLKVGMPVIAIGNPFGLSGSITFGIVSQLGRTIQYRSTSGSFNIADVIQFSAPINPGNSGGPLMNVEGKVVGITSADVSGSQGVGFAIPSDTALRELPYLISTGKYDMHPYIGIDGADMNYQLSQATASGVTYGVLVEKVSSNSPAAVAGLKAGHQVVDLGAQQYLVGGDIIVTVNGTRIVNYDTLATYLERNSLPGQTLYVGVIRSGKHQTIQITVGTQLS
jgi:S1-C subfamily serine protease